MTDQLTPTKRDRHKEVVRERVLKAWGELLSESGYGATTVADVAVRAGMVRSSVYRYFPDKEALLFGYIEERIAAFVQELREEVFTANDAPTRMRRLVVGELRRFASSPEIVRADVPGQLSREGRARLMACFEPLRDMAREIIEQGQVDGTLAALDADKALPVVLACIDVFRDALARQWVDPEVIADDIADFVLRGLGGADPGAAPRRHLAEPDPPRVRIPRKSASGP